MALSLVTAPTTEPVSLRLAKKQVRQDLDVDDDLLRDVIIPAARERGELATLRAWVSQTWDLVLDGFPGCGWIEIPKPPLVSVQWVKYQDMQGTWHTMTAGTDYVCLLYTSPSPRDGATSRMPSSA